jgi:hypothetical protein
VHAKELDENDTELDEASLALKPIDAGEKKNRFKSEKKSGKKCCSVLCKLFLYFIEYFMIF